MEIKIYTDGACIGNPGPGGWAAIILFNNKKKEVFGGVKLTTNNRMELLSVIVGLECLKKEKTAVIVYSDSKYVVDAVEKKWVFAWEIKNFGKKKNPDLWIRFLKLYRKHTVKFFWIIGHADNKEYERCDELAVKAAGGDNLKIDSWYENNVADKPELF